MGWKGRRVFVTGATGVIGSALTRRLIAEGADVTALVFERPEGSDLLRSNDIDKVKQIDGRLEDAPLLETILAEGRFDAVFHLGAQALVETVLLDPVGTFETNIKGSYNLLDACRKAGDVKAVVVASSDKAYGSADVLPYTEEMALEGRFPYEVSKSCTDLLAFAYHRTYQLPVAVTRCGNVYGPGDLNWSRIVPGTIKSLLAGERPVIRSDGKFKRDYIFVKISRRPICLRPKLWRRADAPARHSTSPPNRRSRFLQSSTRSAQRWGPRWYPISVTPSTTKLGINTSIVRKPAKHSDGSRAIHSNRGLPKP